jgi:hypothetical protein
MSLPWRPEAGSPAVPGGPVAVAPARIGCPQGAPSQAQDPGKVVLVGVDGSVSGRTALGAAALQARTLGLSLLGGACATQAAAVVVDLDAADSTAAGVARRP